MSSFLAFKLLTSVYCLLPPPSYIPAKPPKLVYYYTSALLVDDLLAILEMLFYSSLNDGYLLLKVGLLLPPLSVKSLNYWSITLSELKCGGPLLSFRIALPDLLLSTVNTADP